MYEKLLTIYRDKIIEVKDTFYPNTHYYFYNEKGVLFGINKNIAYNEYLILKAMYLEKTFYFDNIFMQKIHEYLFEKGQYPFLTVGKILIYYGVINNEQEKINNLLKDIFQDLHIIKYLDLNIVFYFDKNDIEIKPLFQTISDDFGFQVYVHEGMKINNKLLGIDIITYLNSFLSCTKLLKKDYSNLADLLFNLPLERFQPFIKVLKVNLIDILKDEYREILQVFFNNDLNISKSAKLLYMHRNSLINKLDLISKELGLNIQKFKHAAAILFLMNNEF